MADLFQSEYEMGALRRGVQDGETLWQLLAEDGTIAIVPDPTEAAQESAVKELAKANEEKAKREREGKSLDSEEEKEEADKIAALSRIVNFTPPTQLPAEEEDEEPRRGAKAEQQPAEARR